MSIRIVMNTREARARAIGRLSRARNPRVHAYRDHLIDVGEDLAHYRWLCSARMSEIAAWADPIVSGVDELICQTVYRSIEAAQAEGGNWADGIESDLRREGIETASRQPDGSDPWEIVYLTHGRMVVLDDESACGSDRYSVVERSRA
jgi:hypothetical protein